MSLRPSFPLLSIAMLAACGGAKHDYATPTPQPAGIALQDAACFATSDSGGSNLVGGVSGRTPGATDDTVGASVLAELAARAPKGLTPALVGRPASSGRAAHYDVRYFGAGVPVCGELTQVHVVRDQIFVDHELGVAGEVSLPDAAQWGDPAAVVAMAAAQLGASGMAQAVRRADRCLLLNGTTAEAGWELHASIGLKPYFVIGSAQRIKDVSERQHTETAEARVYSTNPRDGNLASISLPDVSGDVLSSPRFDLVVDDGSPAAQATDGRFDFPATDPRFADASLFAHAEEMAAWFNSSAHHFQMTCLPLVIHAHSVFTYYGGSDVNNAMYTGPDDTENGEAMIQVGDGDGVVLQNLGVDFDVVSHELGHHVIYRRLQSRSGESGVIHEGLADYFVFAHNNSSCLGPSICPAGSTQCVIDSQCLRSGANQLTLDSPDLSTEVHLRSQFISGMLWDLGNSAGLSQDAVATLVIKAIDYLAPASGYGDLINGMMEADLELNGGTHACTIYSEAVARGLASEILSLDCKAYQKGS